MILGRNWLLLRVPAGCRCCVSQVKLVYYAAHDTNLLYLAELLDLKWVSGAAA